MRSSGRGRLPAWLVRMWTRLVRMVLLGGRQGREGGYANPPPHLSSAGVLFRVFSDRVELLLLRRLDEAIEHFVDLGPARQLLHVVEPALHVGIGRKITADDLAQRHQRSAEIVGDSDLVAAQ